MTYTQEDFEPSLNEAIDLLRLMIHLTATTDASRRKHRATLDRIIAAYRDLVAENKRLRSCLEVTEEVKSEWKERAEAAEKNTRIIASERQHGAVSMRFEYADGSSNSYPLAAWGATNGGAE